MKKVAFGKNGDYLSQACLGCMLMGTKIDKETSFKMLDRFIEEGGNFLDTANCYAWWLGNGEFVGDESEKLLGEWMRARNNREQVFLATKVGARLKDPKGIRNDRGEIQWDRIPGDFQYLAPDTIRLSVEDSLRRLQTDYIDLYYVHVDDRNTPIEETLSVLNDLVETGKVRNIGCSNYRTWRLERARSISKANNWAPFSAVQQQYTYIRPTPGADFGVGVHADDELFDYISNNEDVTLLAYSPLLKGIYDDQAKRESYYNWGFFNNDDTRARLERLFQKSKDMGVSNSQLVLAWLLHHNPQVIPVLGASTMEQMEQNLKALTISLTNDDMSFLNGQ